MAEQLGAAIRERFACKSFLPDPVPDETLREILKLTQRAPTGFNTQAYVCIVLRSAEDREKLAGAMMDANAVKVKGAPVAVVFAADCDPAPRGALLGRARPERVHGGVGVQADDVCGRHLPVRRPGARPRDVPDGRPGPSQGEAGAGHPGPLQHPRGGGAGPREPGGEACQTVGALPPVGDFLRWQVRPVAGEVLRGELRRDEIDVTAACAVCSTRCIRARPPHPGWSSM
ncbi:hypothetical protein ON010_g9361 [Phytophthora cinnamomi]|nr:hypothetical protein ON010_g9361 [Phytophthora cinnamomi]